MTKMGGRWVMVFFLLGLFASEALGQVCTGTNSCDSGCAALTYPEDDMPTGEGLVGGRTYNICTNNTAFDDFASAVAKNGANINTSVSDAVTNWNSTLSHLSSPDHMSFTLNQSGTCDITITAENKGSGGGGADWEASDPSASTPSTTGTIVLNTYYESDDGNDYLDFVAAHEMGHAAGFADTNSSNSDCNSSSTIMWGGSGVKFQPNTPVPCEPTNCDADVLEQDIYNCSGSEPSCTGDNSAGCLDDSWYCGCDPTSGACDCTDECDSSCSDYDPSDPDCCSESENYAPNVCYDVSDPNCTNVPVATIVISPTAKPEGRQ
jgi:hypothetical protein